MRLLLVALFCAISYAQTDRRVLQPKKPAPAPPKPNSDKQPTEADKQDRVAAGNEVHKDGGREQSRAEETALEELEGIQTKQGKTLQDVARLNSEVQGKLGEFNELDKKAEKVQGAYVTAVRKDQGAAVDDINKKIAAVKRETASVDKKIDQEKALNTAKVATIQKAAKRVERKVQTVQEEGEAAVTKQQEENKKKVEKVVRKEDQKAEAVEAVAKKNQDAVDALTKEVAEEKVEENADLKRAEKDADAEVAKDKKHGEKMIQEAKKTADNIQKLADKQLRQEEKAVQKEKEEVKKEEEKQAKVAKAEAEQLNEERYEEKKEVKALEAENSARLAETKKQDAVLIETAKTAAKKKADAAAGALAEAEKAAAEIVKKAKEDSKETVAAAVKAGHESGEELVKAAIASADNDKTIFVEQAKKEAAEKADENEKKKADQGLSALGKMNERIKELQKTIGVEKRKVAQLRQHANNVLEHGANILKEVGNIDTGLIDAEKSVGAATEMSSGYSLNKIIVYTLAGTNLVSAWALAKYYLETKSLSQIKYTFLEEF